MSLLESKMAEREKLDAEIGRLKEQEKGNAIKQISVLVDQYNLRWSDVSRLFPKKTGRRTGPVALSGPYYQNPKTGQTYKRGPKPGWLKAMTPEQQKACRKIA